MMFSIHDESGPFFASYDFISTLSIASYIETDGKKPVEIHMNFKKIYPGLFVIRDSTRLIDICEIKAFGSFVLLKIIGTNLVNEVNFTYNFDAVIIKLSSNSLLDWLKYGF